MAAATQRVLVTGANKGIGLAICTKLLDDHPSCHVLMGSRDASRGAAALKTLEDAKPGRKGRVSMVEIDVTDKASITKAAADVQKQGALLHGLINNAGIAFGSMPDVLAVNVYGAHDTTDAFLPLIDPANGRVVTISSAAAPNFVEKCTPERQAFFKSPVVTWDQIDGIMKDTLAAGGDASALGMPPIDEWFGYGLSKACVNLLTMMYAREHPNLKINAVSPGYIETDLTRPIAQARGKQPTDMGMKSPDNGAIAPVFLMMGDVKSSGWYYGSDAKRSPMDRYRSPGDPEYDGS